MDGAGIVTMGGGFYLPYAYSMIKLLRHHGCKLPILFCYQGRKEEPPTRIADDLDCDFLDIAPFRRVGWQAKAVCMIASKFQHVIWNDADAFWLSDGAWMFESEEYKRDGYLFWNDDHHTVPHNEALWAFACVPYAPVKWPAAGTLFFDRGRHEDVLLKVDSIMSHPTWRYVEDNDRGAWHLGFANKGLTLNRLPMERVNLSRAMIYHDLKRYPWIYHITRTATNSFKLVYSVKAHPNCTEIRGYIKEYDRLMRGSL